MVVPAELMLGDAGLTGTLTGFAGRTGATIFQEGVYFLRLITPAWSVTTIEV